MTAVCVICSSILSDVNLGGSSPPIWMTITRNTVTTLVSEATVLLTTYLWYFALLLAFQGLPPRILLAQTTPRKRTSNIIRTLISPEASKAPPPMQPIQSSSLAQFR